MDVGHLAPEDVRLALPERNVEAAEVGEACRGGLHALPDERVGMLRPRDADAELLERLQLAPLEAGRQRLEHRRARLDVARHRARVVVRGRERPTAVERDEPVGRLEADDAAAGRRDADRPSRVGAERRVREAEDERRGITAARAAGDAPRRGGVRHGAVMRVLGGRPVRELVQVRLADVRVAGVLEPPHRFGRGRRDVPGEDRRAVRRLEPRRVEEVLDREPHAVGRRLWPGEKDPVWRQSKAR